MREALWVIPTLSYLGFVVLALYGRGLTPSRAAVVGVGTVGISALLVLALAIEFMTSPPPGHAYVQVLWQWMEVEGFRPPVSLRLDALSVIMMLVITGVGFLIHLYSAEFMRGEEGYSRFFAYMNLFVGSMLVLVLADNLLLLYLGWEGVGLCSYLLIGFWYRDPENGYAARKAFVVTRVGDTAFAIALFLIFTHLGTLDIQEAMQQAGRTWGADSGMAIAAAALLLGGAVGKSAQLPLQVWLPDAMAGPTPVSALIHAATMVTAGVYLIARTHVLFALAPPVMLAVAVIGAATLLLAGFSALTQWDIKRALAYSTISQIGYMFLALGVGAWSAALFHFMTHAFFKALLFLGAGAVIMNLHHEHDMGKMGGLRTQLPLTFWTFLIGASSLSALPVVTAGFYSKDLILHNVGTSESGSLWLWGAGVLGAFLTSLYSFRMVFLTFFGEAKGKASGKPGPLIRIPLVVLAFFSLVAGLVEMPSLFAYAGLDVHLFTRFLQTTLPGITASPLPLSVEIGRELIIEALQLGGILLAYMLFLYKPGIAGVVARTPWGEALQRLWRSGWGFDRVYSVFFIRPFVWIARVNREDAVDLPYVGMIWAGFKANRFLSRTQSGKVRWYAAGIGLGALVLLGIVVLL
ncbi:MAG: NADH-quinone oxidoreductase subunit L [Nitrospirales bacterium]|nr:NADH-quinone oxidoreductase subunit L [Nitrospirales bacterium]